MRQSFKKTISILLVLIVTLCSFSSSFAVDNETQSPLKIEITTNKNSYCILGIAKFTVKITNVSDEIIENISAEALFDKLAPCGKDSRTSAEAQNLSIGDSIEFNFMATLSREASDLNSIQKFCIALLRLFYKNVPVVNNEFDDGRLYVDASKSVVFGSINAEQIIRVFYGEKRFELTASKNEFETSATETEVFFYAKPLYSNMQVYLVDASTDLKLSQMKDDGQYSSSGDDIMNDGVFSCKLSLDSQTEKTLTVYAVAYENDEDLTVSSNSCDIHIFIYSELTDSQIISMNNVDEEISQLLMSSSFTGESYERKQQLVGNLLDELTEQGEIIENTITFDKSTGIYSFEYKCNISGGVMIKDFADEINGSEHSISYNDQGRTATATNEYELAPQNTEIENDVGDALILFSFENDNFRVPFYEDTEIKWDNNGLHTDRDMQVTVEDLRNIDNDYEVICFSGHGSTYKNQPTMCLEEVVTDANRKQYSADIKKNRIVVVTLTSGETVYWVFPSFFSNTYGSSGLSGKFIFSECCNFFGKGSDNNNAFSNAFLEAGAEVVVGFHNSVLAVYCRDFMKHWVDKLIGGNTARKSFDSSLSKFGSNDGGNPPATPNFRGNNNAVLIDRSIRNGDFDNKINLRYWTTKGDVRSVSKLGELVPQDGKHMAILTTGIGSMEAPYLAGTEGSVLQQTFIMPSSKSNISFYYNVISEEPTEYVGSQYDDKFIAQILDKNGEVLNQIAYESVNNATWYQIDDIDFEGGDQSVYQTGWKKASVDVSAYKNQQLTIRFLVFDVGDSLYDTAALVDSVQIY